MMTQKIKDEALEQIMLGVKFGFENEDELFETIRETFYDEKGFEEDWLREELTEAYNQHQSDSLTWARPTDFDKLAKSFDELIREKIVCLHKAGFTKQDGESDCLEVIDRLDKLGIKAKGFCFYHEQDLGRAVDVDTQTLLLSFDSPTQNNDEAVEVAKHIVSTLTRHGFQVNWPGKVDQRIEIKKINWQKLPDDEDWGAERVIHIMTTTG